MSKQNLRVPKAEKQFSDASELDEFPPDPNSCLPTKVRMSKKNCSFSCENIDIRGAKIPILLSELNAETRLYNFGHGFCHIVDVAEKNVNDELSRNRNLLQSLFSSRSSKENLPTLLKQCKVSSDSMFKSDEEKHMGSSEMQFEEKSDFNPVQRDSKDLVISLQDIVPEMTPKKEKFIFPESVARDTSISISPRTRDSQTMTNSMSQSRLSQTRVFIPYSRNKFCQNFFGATFSSFVRKPSFLESSNSSVSHKIVILSSCTQVYSKKSSKVSANTSLSGQIKIDNYARQVICNKKNSGTTNKNVCSSDDEKSDERVHIFSKSKPVDTSLAKRLAGVSTEIECRNNNIPLKFCGTKEKKNKEQHNQQTDGKESHQNSIRAIINTSENGKKNSCADLLAFQCLAISDSDEKKSEGFSNFYKQQNMSRPPKLVKRPDTIRESNIFNAENSDSFVESAPPTENNKINPDFSQSKFDVKETICNRNIKILDIRKFLTFGERSYPPAQNLTKWQATFEANGCQHPMLVGAGEVPLNHLDKNFGSGDFLDSTSFTLETQFAITINPLEIKGRRRENAKDDTLQGMDDPSFLVPLLPLEEVFAHTSINDLNPEKPSVKVPDPFIMQAAQQLNMTFSYKVLPAEITVKSSVEDKKRKYRIDKDSQIESKKVLEKPSTNLTKHKNQEGHCPLIDTFYSETNIYSLANAPSNGLKTNCEERKDRIPKLSSLNFSEASMLSQSFLPSSSQDSQLKRSNKTHQHPPLGTNKQNFSKEFSLTTPNQRIDDSKKDTCEGDKPENFDHAGSDFAKYKMPKHRLTTRAFANPSILGKESMRVRNRQVIDRSEAMEGFAEKCLLTSASPSLVAAKHFEKMASTEKNNIVQKISKNEIDDMKKVLNTVPRKSTAKASPLELNSSLSKTSFDMNLLASKSPKTKDLLITKKLGFDSLIKSPEHEVECVLSQTFDNTLFSKSSQNIKSFLKAVEKSNIAFEKQLIQKLPDSADHSVFELGVVDGKKPLNIQEKELAKHEEFSVTKLKTSTPNLIKSKSTMDENFTATYAGSNLDSSINSNEKSPIKYQKNVEEKFTLLTKGHHGGTNKKIPELLLDGVNKASSLIQKKRPLKAPHPPVGKSNGLVKATTKVIKYPIDKKKIEVFPAILDSNLYTPSIMLKNAQSDLVDSGNPKKLTSETFDSQLLESFQCSVSIDATSTREL